MTTTIDIDQLAGALADDLETAFPELVRRLADDVFSGCLRMLGNRADAEEVAQEAFLRAYRALRDYDGGRIRALRIRGWVWTIAANLCRNRLRSRARHPETELSVDPPDTTSGPEAAAITSAERAELATRLGRLPWPVRSAVVLRHVVGLSYDEIAEALERPVGTVKSDVHRGLERLRREGKDAS